MTRPAPGPGGRAATRWRKGGFALAALALGSAVLILTAADIRAQCLTRDDLANGVRAVYLDGAQVDYRRAEADLIRVVERPDPAAPEAVEFLSRHGLYEIEAQGLADGQAVLGQHLRYSYHDAEGNLPPAPQEGGTWLGQSVTTYADGETELAEAIYVYGREDRVTLAGCAYSSIPVKATFLVGEDWVTQEYSWLPELGIGLLTGRSESSVPRGSLYRLSGLARIAS